MGKEWRGCFDPGTPFGYLCVFKCGRGKDALLKKSELSGCAKIESLHEVQGHHNGGQDDSEIANGGDSQSHDDNTAPKL